MCVLHDVSGPGDVGSGRLPAQQPEPDGSAAGAAVTWLRAGPAAPDARLREPQRTARALHPQLHRRHQRKSARSQTSTSSIPPASQGAGVRLGVISVSHLGTGVSLGPGIINVTFSVDVNVRVISHVLECQMVA